MRNAECRYNCESSDFNILADEVMIFDNSKMIPELIAEKTINSDISVLSHPKFNQLQNQYYENI